MLMAYFRLAPTVYGYVGPGTKSSILMPSEEITRLVDQLDDAPIDCFITAVAINCSPIPYTDILAQEPNQPTLCHPLKGRSSINLMMHLGLLHRGARLLHRQMALVNKLKAMKVTG